MIDYRKCWDDKMANEKEETNMTETQRMAKENERLKFWLKIAGIGLLVTGGCTLYCAANMFETRRLLTGAIDKIKDAADIRIDEQIVKKAVNDASYEAASRVANEAVKRVQSEMLGEVRMRVKTAVGDAKDVINDAVAAKIAKEVAGVSKDEIVDAVVEATTDKLTEKLEEDVGDEMTKVGEIYKNIVEALT